MAGTWLRLRRSRPRNKRPRSTEYGTFKNAAGLAWRGRTKTGIGGGRGGRLLFLQIGGGEICAEFSGQAVPAGVLGVRWRHGEGVGVELLLLQSGLFFVSPMISCPLAHLANLVCFFLPIIIIIFAELRARATELLLPVSRVSLHLAPSRKDPICRPLRSSPTLR